MKPITTHNEFPGTKNWETKKEISSVGLQITNRTNYPREAPTSKKWEYNQQVKVHIAHADLWMPRTFESEVDGWGEGKGAELDNLTAPWRLPLQTSLLEGEPTYP